MWCLVVTEGRKTVSCSLESVRDGVYTFEKFSGPAVVRYLLIFDGYTMVAAKPVFKKIAAGEVLYPEFKLK